MTMKCNELVDRYPNPKPSKIKCFLRGCIISFRWILQLGYGWLWPIVAYLFYCSHTQKLVNYSIFIIERAIHGENYQSEFCCSRTVAELLSVLVCIIIHYALQRVSEFINRVSESKPVGS